jgi:dolichyl-phosphate-mannose--protein O-mannosyl transferase
MGIRILIKTIITMLCRFVPALAGSLLTPLSYSIMKELGLSSWSGAIAGFMILFGKIIM